MTTVPPAPVPASRLQAMDARRPKNTFETSKLSFRLRPATWEKPPKPDAAAPRPKKGGVFDGW